MISGIPSGPGRQPGAEDEKDLDLVHFDLELYEAYVRGYLEAAGEVADPGGGGEPSVGSKADDPGVRHAFPDRLSSGGYVF